MDARAILDGLLDSTQRATKAGIELAEQKSVIPPAGDERTAMLKGLGTGALAAGAVAMLFGSKGTRKFAKKAVKIGGTAAIGGLAYKAFTDWQAAQAGGGGSTGSPQPGQPSSPGSLDLDQFQVGTPIGDLPTQAAERRSEHIVQAMISAARADGHIDSEELDLITRQIQNMGLEKDVSAFLLAELNKPVKAEAIAGLADTPETAAELYIASALVVDMDEPAERQYLDSLASAMNLDADMIRRLEAPIRG